MRKRVIAMLLTLALLLPMLAGLVPEAKAAEADLESEIRQQLTAYISTLGTSNASGARNKLINHALYGKGEDLHMGEQDVFTIAALNSNLLRENLVDTLTNAIEYSRTLKTDTLYIGGSCSWYDGAMNFSNSVYSQALTESDDHANRVIFLNSCSMRSGWVFNPNTCDDAMVDVVGSSNVRITMHKTACNPDTTSWDIKLMVRDDFDFDSGENISNIIGNLMTGIFIETYSWDATAEFSISVTNTCAHQTGDYRWEFSGIHVTSDTANPLSKIQTKNSDGTLSDPYYKTEKDSLLDSSRPWVVEFRSKGSYNIGLMPSKSFIDGAPLITKGATFMHMGYVEKHVEYESEEVSSVNYIRHYYSVKFTRAGYSSENWHTYRLENRLENGANMVYLLTDGEEIGPMVEYWSTVGGDTGEIGDWVSGQDFRVSYIGNTSYRLNPKLEIDYIQIWENGEGNEPYSYFETTTTAPTCTEPGKLVHTCSLCGASYSEETGEAALGHAWDDGVVTAPATCTTDGVLTYTCANDPSHTRTEVIPATGHTPVTDAAVDATCTADGLTEGSHCETCGEVLTAQETVPALGHVWDEGSEVTKPTVNAPGTIMYTCTVCGELRSEEVPYESHVSRLAGEHRYETAFKAADQMKENLGIKKFDAVVVASGTNFADALSGSYLAAVKEAPILLACDVEWVNDLVKDYIYQNLNEDGTIYILGGEGAVPASFEEGLEDFEIERLAGGNRFETNLMVLEEAGVDDKPILVCTGLEFADSLSASATKLPILLVYGNKLLDDQAAFLKANQGRDLYILGGEGAVSAKLESALTNYGDIERVAGNNRFETSTLIAETFFEKPESAVLAYAWGFPDGLCGGPLATTMNAPLILTMEKYEAKAAEYIQANAIGNAVILGGETLIPDSSVNILFP